MRAQLEKAGAEPALAADIAGGVCTYLLAGCQGGILGLDKATIGALTGRLIG
ncbi:MULTISPECIES: hypothetical protein [Thalassobaculum]|uniref:hypothetical protein n=1 Tax=Thalassobaculum TaxID=526215 RepID=UPI0015874061|nr:MULTISPECIES: hypothetical protein [Thalassobaculum]